MPLPTSEESLERAVQHVSDGWIPPQFDVLSRIQDRFAAGDYENDRGQLIGDLKGDVSLYLYCLKELSALSEVGPGSAERTDSLRQKPANTPVELLYGADIEDLQRILNRSLQAISLHSFEEINKFQVLRYRESLLSASASEVLTESLSVDPEIGFSCALLRQLGLALIAWN